MLGDPYRRAGQVGTALVLVGFIVVGMAAGTTLAIAEVDDDCQQTLDVPGVDSEPQDCEQTMAQLGSWTNCLLAGGAVTWVAGFGVFGYLRYDDGGDADAE